MALFRRGFYLILGFTFPGFWMFHAGGYKAGMYLPIQKLFNTSSSGWPSLISASLLYLIAIVIFELTYRLLKDARPS